MRRWLARAGLGYVLWRWLGPEPRPRFPIRQEHPLRLAGRSVFVGDRELFVREAGPEDGPALVLIHGWATNSLFNWYKIIPLLSDRYRLFAIDQRNSGKSDLVRARYDIAEVADEIAGAIAALGLTSVAVVGFSMGGMIAQELVRRHPHLVMRLVLGGTAACIAPSLDKRIELWVLLWLGRLWDRISRYEFSWIRQSYLRDVGAIEPHHERWAWDTYMGRDVNLYYEGGFAAARFDSRDWVRRIELETLVIIPTKDQLILPERQYELLDLLPNARLVEIKGGRHESVLTHPEHFAAAIDEFLSSGRQPTPPQT